MPDPIDVPSVGGSHPSIQLYEMQEGDPSDCPICFDPMSGTVLTTSCGCSTVEHIHEHCLSDWASRKYLIDLRTRDVYVHCLSNSHQVGIGVLRSSVDIPLPPLIQGSEDTRSEASSFVSAFSSAPKKDKIDMWVLPPDNEEFLTPPENEVDRFTQMKIDEVTHHLLHFGEGNFPRHKVLDVCNMDDNFGEIRREPADWKRREQAAYFHHFGDAEEDTQSEASVLLGYEFDSESEAPESSADPLDCWEPPKKPAEEDEEQFYTPPEE